MQRKDASPNMMFDDKLQFVFGTDILESTTNPAFKNLYEETKNDATPLGLMLIPHSGGQIEKDTSRNVYINCVDYSSKSPADRNKQLQELVQGFTLAEVDAHYNQGLIAQSIANLNSSFDGNVIFQPLARIENLFKLDGDLYFVAKHNEFKFRFRENMEEVFYIPGRIEFLYKRDPKHGFVLEKVGLSNSVFAGYVLGSYQDIQEKPDPETFVCVMAAMAYKQECEAIINSKEINAVEVKVLSGIMQFCDEITKTETVDKKNIQLLWPNYLLAKKLAVGESLEDEDCENLFKSLQQSNMSGEIAKGFLEHPSVVSKFNQFLVNIKVDAFNTGIQGMSQECREAVYSALALKNAEGLDREFIMKCADRRKRVYSTLPLSRRLTLMPKEFVNSYPRASLAIAGGLLLAGVGVALTATGVLAPLGVAIGWAGLSVAAPGLGVTAAVGGFFLVLPGVLITLGVGITKGIKAITHLFCTPSKRENPSELFSSTLQEEKSSNKIEKNQSLPELFPPKITEEKSSPKSFSSIKTPEKQGSLKLFSPKISEVEGSHQLFLPKIPEISEDDNNLEEDKTFSPQVVPTRRKGRVLGRNNS